MKHGLGRGELQRHSFLVINIIFHYILVEICGSMERKSESDRDKHDAQKAQVTVSKPIATRYPHSPAYNAVLIF